jgi:hypothetical protein
MRQGVEILSGQGVNVKRPDRDDLLAIRNGKLTYDELIALAEDYDRQLDDLYEKSDLPHAPDVEQINRLLVEVYRNFWAERGA